MILGVISVFFGLGVIGALAWYFLYREVSWCEKAHPDKLEVDSKFDSFIGGCSSPQCQIQRERLSEHLITDPKYFEGASHAKIEKDCGLMCKYFVELSKCECEVCDKCHPRCKASSFDKCDKTFFCGTKDKIVFKGY